VSNPVRKTNEANVPADPYKEQEEFRRRLAERGILIQLPSRDGEWTLPEPIPVSADELSDMVVRMRRGEV
jgi:hypothetical protein